MDPETIILNQLEAYNDRDVELFASYFTEDVELYDFGKNEPILIGKAKLKRVYNQIFDQSPNLHAVLENKMVLANTVIYHEKVTGRIDDEVLEVLAIYEIEKELIKRLTFVR